VRTGEPRRLAESQGFRWSPAFADSVARIWYGHARALLALRDHPLVLHPVSGAHHAGYERGGGFCTFNYLVGAARTLLGPGQRSAIIDLDAHWGDGTARLVQGDERFRVFDMTEGYPGSKEFGPGPIVWENGIDLRVKDAADYLHALRVSLPTVLDETKPTSAQYLAGADPYEQDPVGGLKGMTVGVLCERDEIVLRELRNRGIPTVVTFAGGYVPGTTEKIHLNTVRVMATVGAFEPQDLGVVAKGG
jgi:acetoin utilization deacetylase AcuC-like enzyme